MEKNIKDYLHLYKDVHIKIEHPDKELPILRPLSDMSEAEMRDYRIIDHNSSPDNILPEIKMGALVNAHFSKRNAALTAFLISKHFDLFGLIESGLAIDKTKISQNQIS